MDYNNEEGNSYEGNVDSVVILFPKNMDSNSDKKKKKKKKQQVEDKGSHH